ncbi:MAG: glycerophosphodiester phosphodiesterase [Ignavibacteriaceae bacterium]
MKSRLLNIAIFILSVLFCTGCDKLPPVAYSIDESGIIQNTNRVNDSSKILIEGIYRITEGNNEFGNFAVVKSTRDYFSIFCEGNNSYFILKSGEKDSTYYFEGYWRFSQNATSGYATLKMSKEEGGDSVFRRIVPISNRTIRGFFGTSAENPTSSLRMEYSEPIKKDSSIYILAHRGGGRNSDRLPASENSLEIIQMAEYFGANGVEIDIQLTKDNIPILFHDELFTQRLVAGNYLIGKVSNFSFKQIRTFGRLIHNEKIPTLQEALDIIIRKTKLKLVWIDVKYPEAVSVVAEIQKAYIEIARTNNREVTILIGIPSEEVFNEYQKLPQKESNPALCELELKFVKQSDARVWAPRWTDGVPLEQINTAHSENRKVFTWTLDTPEMIKDFYNTGYYEGILTNYPSILAYQYYTGDK